MPGPDAAARRARARRTAQYVTEAGTPAVLTRPEWLALGWTDDAVAWRRRIGAWTAPTRGQVATGPAAPDATARIYSAWLAGGEGALVAGRAAAYLLGLSDEAPEVVEVLVPHRRTPLSRTGIRIRRTRRAPEHRPLAGVRVTSVEETVLDLVGAATSVAAAVFWVERACGRRLTTPDLLLEAVATRSRLRHRRVVVAVCARVGAGETTYLERWFSARVLRDHGLPAGRRQVRRRVAGRTNYSDVEIEEYGVVIELDGRLGHEDERGRFRDRTRDNSHAAAGRQTLRYGWADSTRSPCAVAGQVAAVLHARGWAGQVRPCGPQCTAPDEWVGLSGP